MDLEEITDKNSAKRAMIYSTNALIEIVENVPFDELSDTDIILIGQSVFIALDNVKKTLRDIKTEISVGEKIEQIIKEKKEIAKNEHAPKTIAPTNRAVETVVSSPIPATADKSKSRGQYNF